MSDRKLSVLVTGANGFLGSAIISALQQHPHVQIIAACRDRLKLPPGLQALAREGDLRDEKYRRKLVADIDVVCHAGTWASMWGNKTAEYTNFLQPSIDLILQAQRAGVKRFIMTSTLVVCDPRQRKPIDDFASARKTGFWPHLDYLIDVESFMQTHANASMQMISMRLGHFVGAGNKLGIVPVLIPRLKTHLVPWLAGGKSRMPLVSGIDMGRAFTLAVNADSNKLDNYESFNIVGNCMPSTREVLLYLCEKTGAPKPRYSVPFFMGHAFAWIMEKLFPLLPGKAPFLTQSIVHLARDWSCTGDRAKNKLGFIAQQAWQGAIDEAIIELHRQGTDWPPLMQKL